MLLSTVQNVNQPKQTPVMTQITTCSVQHEDVILAITRGRHPCKYPLIHQVTINRSWSRVSITCDVHGILDTCLEYTVQGSPIKRCLLCCLTKHRAPRSTQGAEYLTLNTWNASNWMLGLLSLSRFIISLRFSGLLMYLVMMEKLCRSRISSPSSYRGNEKKQT